MEQWVAGTSPAMTFWFGVGAWTTGEHLRNDHLMSAVYILASQPYGTLYVGVTADLIRRVGQHRDGEIAGFTRRHGVKRLVWFERHDAMVDAIQREKSLKKYKRQWKINLIERDNPHWHDLYPAFFRVDGPFSHLQAPAPSL